MKESVDLEGATPDQLMAAFDQFLAELTTEQLTRARDVFAERVQNDELMCRMYESFRGPDDARHNCLGCNFNNMTAQVQKYLNLCVKNPGHFTLEETYSVLVLLLNGLWERIADVFELIALPEQYRVRHFAIFVRLRRWANFFKHPRAFGWLVHHPIYTLQGSEHHAWFVQSGNILEIDDEFVKRFYAPDRPKGLASQFKGKENQVVVSLPDLDTVMPAVCSALAKFVEVVLENPVYREILDERSTLVDYITASEQDDSPTSPA